MYEIEDYVTPDGRDVFAEWYLKVRDAKAIRAVDRRLARVVAGNFGDHKFCRDGVWELRVDVGAGYRIYYAISGSTLVILLCGGDKRTQPADIDRACEYWKQLKGAKNDADKKPRRSDG